MLSKTTYDAPAGQTHKLTVADNDCHSEKFVSQLDPAFLSGGDAVNRIDANERKQALRELEKRKRFEMHKVGRPRKPQVE